MINFKAFQLAANQVATNAGWYQSRDLSDPDVRDGMLALITSEISEALECIRNPDPIWLTLVMHVRNPHYTQYGPIPGEVLVPYAVQTPLRKPEGLPSEIADVIIRVCDYAYAYGIEFGENPVYGTCMFFKHAVTPTSAAAHLHMMNKL